jgi:hypothetical protein
MPPRPERARGSPGAGVRPHGKSRPGSSPQSQQTSSYTSVLPPSGRPATMRTGWRRRTTVPAMPELTMVLSCVRMHGAGLGRFQVLAAAVGAQAVQCHHVHGDDGQGPERVGREKTSGSRSPRCRRSCSRSRSPATARTRTGQSHIRAPPYRSRPWPTALLPTSLLTSVPRRRTPRLLNGAPLPRFTVIRNGWPGPGFLIAFGSGRPVTFRLPGPSYLARADVEALR